MAVDPIKVQGLKELRKELKAADASFPKELQVANKKVAQSVAEGTKASFLSRGGVAPKVAPSVKALAQQARAQVRIGGAKYPFAMGAEFGGGKYRKGHPTPKGGYTSQFEVWRGNGPGAGYSLYETLRNQREDIVDRYAEMLDDLLKRAFPD